MVKRILLENFRRHSHSEIHFDDQRQLTLIAGRNGAGKSTIFHAIVWALCNESPDGKRGLDTLVRRGSEHAGCRVEVDLDIDGNVYTVVRERRGKTANARILLDNQILVEGAGAVTDAVADLLGVDNIGLRLAIYAGQGELDGLASMRPADRATAIERLLHLDLLTKARETARTETRAKKTALDSIGATIDTDQAETTLKQLTAQLTASEQQLAQLDERIEQINTQLTDGDTQRAQWQQLEETRARLNGKRDAVRELHQAAVATVRELEHATATCAGETNRHPDGQQTDWDETVRQLTAEANELEQRIAQAEATRHVLDHRQTCSREIATATARRAIIAPLLADTAGLSEETAALRSQLEHAETLLLETQLKLNRDLGQFDDGHCPTCGQDVNAEQLNLLHQQQNNHHSHLAELADQVTELKSRLAHKRSLHEQAQTAEREDAELRRRIDVWSEQLERTGHLDDTDLDDLYRQRARTHHRLADAQQHAQQAHEHARAHHRLAEARTRVAELTGQLADLDQALAPDEAHQRLNEQIQQLDQIEHERNRLVEQRNSLANDHARLDERTQAARRVARDARNAARKRKTLATGAQTAADSAHILDTAASDLAGNLRPALAGSVSALVDTLSDGRFTRVGLDEDYTLTVWDDGQPRSLAELSGGERDLVALAVRLGLAELVSDHVGGLGWILLDEVFGSQDHTRRESILTGLRGLKHRFGQILAISHVGDLPDIADRVVTVSLETHDGETTAHVHG